MKKVLLVVGLIVLLFSQSSYSEPSNIFVSKKTGVKWEDWGNKIKGLKEYYNGKRNSEAEIKFYSINHCFNLDAKNYFNVDKCTTLKFTIESPYIFKKKEKSKNTKIVKKFINLAIKDIVRC